MTTSRQHSCVSFNHSVTFTISDAVSELQVIKYYQLKNKKNQQNIYT